jgi:flavin reductase (DIM6/NTAB) family NADH-FMN oxidoreductase RutF
MVMEDRFKIIEPEQIRENIFKLIGDDWMLICAGNIKNYNMMTASWGTCGILWNKPVAVIFIRPQRYTHEFTEKNEYFTLNFLMRPTGGI